MLNLESPRSGRNGDRRRNSAMRFLPAEEREAVRAERRITHALATPYDADGEERECELTRITKHNREQHRKNVLETDTLSQRRAN